MTKEEILKEINKGEVEIYQKKVAEHAKMNLPFAEGFIQGQVSVRNLWLKKLSQILDRAIKKIENWKNIDDDGYELKLKIEEAYIKQEILAEIIKLKEHIRGK